MSLGSPRCCGLPYRRVRPPCHCVRLNVGVGSPGRCGFALPLRSTPLSSRSGQILVLGQPMPLGAALTWWLPLPRRRVLSLGCPRRGHGGLPYGGVRPPVVVAWCRRLALGCHAIMGCPATSFTSLHLVQASGLASPRRCGMPWRSFRSLSSSCGVNLGVGLPMPLWAALGRHSPPFVVVQCRTSA